MFNIDDYYARFWNHSDNEFEAIRSLATDDKSNKTAYNFTKQKLVLEEHVGYGVIFNKYTHAPATMSGLKQMSDGVGRLLNRHYIFPESRNKSFADIVSGLYTIRKLIMEPLILQADFDVHVLTMPNRGNRNGFFDVFHKTHNEAWPGRWHRVNGYIQTGNGMDKGSWQNALSDNPDYKFEVMDHEQWLTLKDSVQT